MGWMPAARRIESSRSVVARASSTDASRLRFGSVPFGSVRFVRSRHVVSVAFATKSAQSHQINRRAVRVVGGGSRAWCVTHGVWWCVGLHGVVDFVECDSPLRTRAYGMVGVGRSSCLNTMEKEKVHIGRPNGYRRVARARVDVLM